MTQKIDGSYQVKGNSIDTAQLAVTAVTPASYGDSTHTPQISIAADGRIVSAANVAIMGATPGGTASGDLSGSFPSPVVDQASTIFRLTGILSPAQITSTQNNYNPTGLSTHSVLLLDSDTGRSITGLTAPAADGDIKLLYYIGSSSIILKNDDAGSSAANRFEMGGDFVLSPNVNGIILQYFGSRWHSAVPNLNTISTSVTVDVDSSPIDSSGTLNFVSGDGVKVVGFSPGPGSTISITVKTILDKVGLTAQIADITTTPFGAGGANGQYRITYYLVCTAADVTAGGIVLTIGYNDGVAARTQVTSSLLLTTTDAASGEFVVRVGDTNPPTYAVSHSGLFGTATYALYLTIEPLGLD